MTRLAAIPAALLLIFVSTLFVTPTPALGSPGAPTPALDNVQRLTLDTSKLKGGATPNVTVSCTAYAAPVPAYSTTNGAKFVQWGAKADCTVQGTIVISTRLYSVEGTGEREHNVLVDSKTIGPQLAWSLGNSWGEPCIGGSGRWFADRTPTWNGYPFSPPIVATNTISLPCVPIP